MTNNGSGFFALSSSPVVGSFPNSVTAADVNGDGKVDLITANYYGNSLTVLTNNGSGGFALASTLTVGNYPWSVTAADINSDGKADLICANSADSTLSVLTNGNAGGFVTASTPSVGSGPLPVVAADVNGDGKVDLVCGNRDDSTLSVLTNNGSGGFVLASITGVGSWPMSLSAADVNGDGQADLVCANYNDKSLSVVTNDRSGNFALAGTNPVGNNPYSIAFADVNRDGQVDLVCANASDNTLSVLTNNGSGLFGPACTPGVGARPFSVAMADVNGDGEMDLICANADDNTLSVLTNATPYRPIITAQPANQTVTAGGTANFSVTVIGSMPLNYQWQFGGTNIVGGTNTTLTLTNVQANQAGNYTVLVTNALGSILSSNAMLTVAVDHFTWSQIPSPRFVNTPFTVSIQARNLTNGIFTDFTGFASLDSINGVAVAPPISGNFTQGVWTGSVLVGQTVSNLVLRAGDGLGHFGLANSIIVFSLPDLAMLRSENIAMFMWPVRYSGFVLESSAGLAPAAWKAVPYTPLQIGDQFLLPLDMTGTNGFYRLCFPGY
jgi:hypothetical protein